MYYIVYYKFSSSILNWYTIIYFNYERIIGKFLSQEQHYFIVIGCVMHKSKQTLGNYIKPDLAVSLSNSLKPEGCARPGSILGPKIVIIYTDNGTDWN